MSDITSDPNNEKLTELEKLWEAVQRRLPEFSPDEQRAGITLLRELATNGPTEADRLGQVLGIPTNEARTFLEESRASPFVQRDRDNADRVLGFWGLWTAPTHHRFTIGDRTLGAWCAMDSLFLPELLGKTAQVESRDPESDELVRLTISPGGIESVEPEQGVVVSVNSPDMWDLTTAEKAIKSACHFVFYFASRESGERWAARHPDTVLLPLEKAFEHGKRQNAHAFGAGSAPTEIGGRSRINVINDRSKTDQIRSASQPLSDTHRRTADMTTIDAGVQRFISVIRTNFEHPDVYPRLMQMLADGGEPVSVERLATESGWNAEDLRAEFTRQPGTDWDGHGRVVGFGVTLRPTPHTFTFGNRMLYATCASGALELPIALGRPGTIESSCPFTSRRIRVEVTSQKVVYVTPPEAVVSKVRPTEAVADLRGEICGLGHFISAPEAAAGWLEQHPQGHVDSVAHEFEIIRRAFTELGWASGTW